jgi:hypothetical protein
MARLSLTFGIIALLTILATAATASADTAVTNPSACGYNGYSYAGETATSSETGISAGITALEQPRITSGHVAAWVGVGGAGLGPGGSNEWLQAGISAASGGPTSLYYELARPGAAPRYQRLPIRIALGRTYRVSVQESPSRPGYWSVWVDGIQRTSGAFLPGSHDAWKPTATSESWDGGTPACNAYDFRFDEVRARTEAQIWSPMGSSVMDGPGYRVEARTASGFTAVGGKA